MRRAAVQNKPCRRYSLRDKRDLCLSRMGLSAPSSELELYNSVRRVFVPHTANFVDLDLTKKTNIRDPRWQACCFPCTPHDQLFLKNNVRSPKNSGHASQTAMTGLPIIERQAEAL